MALYQVKCREKHSLYERILSIGCAEAGTGSHKRFTEDEAIKKIEQGTDRFYVERPAGHRVWLIVALHEGRKYIKTETDGEIPNNLLSLPECPPINPEQPSHRRRVVAAPSHGTQFPHFRFWGV